MINLEYSTKSCYLNEGQLVTIYALIKVKLIDIAGIQALKIFFKHSMSCIRHQHLFYENTYFNM